MSPILLTAELGIIFIISPRRRDRSIQKTQQVSMHRALKAIAQFLLKTDF
jgi:hypothetical protein